MLHVPASSQDETTWAPGLYLHAFGVLLCCCYPHNIFKAEWTGQELTGLRFASFQSRKLTKGMWTSTMLFQTFYIGTKIKRQALMMFAGSMGVS